MSAIFSIESSGTRVAMPASSCDGFGVKVVCRGWSVESVCEETGLLLRDRVRVLIVIGLQSTRRKKLCWRGVAAEWALSAPNTEPKTRNGLRRGNVDISMGG